MAEAKIAGVGALARPTMRRAARWRCSVSGQSGIHSCLFPPAQLITMGKMRAVPERSGEVWGPRSEGYTALGLGKVALV